MPNQGNGMGCEVIVAALVVVVMVVVIGGGALSGSLSARKMEAQAQIATARAQEAQAEAQRTAVLPLAVAAKTDAALTVLYALRDITWNSIYQAAVVVLAAWLLLRKPPQAPQAKEPQGEYPDGTEV